MALTVTTLAKQTQLTTVKRVESELGITDQKSSKRIDVLIKSATDVIRMYTSREFAEQTYSETVSGYGDTLLELSRTPVASVPFPTVALSGDAITDFTIEDPDAGLLFRATGWQWTAQVGFQLSDHVVAYSEDPLFTVVYVAGYKMPGQANANLPQDLEKAAIELVKAWEQDRKADPRVKSKKVDDLTITYRDKSTGPLNLLPTNVIALLQPWRRAA